MSANTKKQMTLLFEESVKGRMIDLIPDCDVPKKELPAGMERAAKPRLPELSEIDIARHYTELAKRTHGVNDGMYPLGSCTMKYNPKVNEFAASLKGFTRLHPLQEEKFDYRLLLRTPYDSGYAYVSLFIYHVKDPEGYYCMWDADTGQFERVRGAGLLKHPEDYPKIQHQYSH